jgi:hypothetical protein
MARTPDPTPDVTCTVIAQVRMSGPQDVAVRCYTAQASPTGHPHAAIRIGALLLYIEDRQAITDINRAISTATEHIDRLFPAADDAFEELVRHDLRQFERQ